MEVTMELCHKNSTLQSPAFEKLGQFVLEWRTRWEKSTPDFERFEHELHEQIMALECEFLTEELARYDVKAEQIKVGGVTYRQALTSSETYLSAAGSLPTERHLYRPAGRGSRSICPLEWRAGIIGGYWTPRAARPAAFAMAHLTPGDRVVLYDSEGERLQTIRYGRMPERRKVTLQQQLETEAASVLAVRPDLQRVL